MRAKKQLLLIGIAGALLLGSNSRAGARLRLPGPQALAQLSPVPIWPSDGVIPKEVSDQYVFYDPRTEEYVIAYPENLGTPQFERNRGRLLVSRFPTARGAKPSIQFSVVREQEKYRYTYQVDNGGGARRPITSWYLATPVRPDGTLTAPSNCVVGTTQSGIKRRRFKCGGLASPRRGAFLDDA
jgi:hypothetical protein